MDCALGTDQMTDRTSDLAAQRTADQIGKLLARVLPDIDISQSGIVPHAGGVTNAVFFVPTSAGDLVVKVDRSEALTGRSFAAQRVAEARNVKVPKSVIFLPRRSAPELGPRASVLVEHKIAGQPLNEESAGSMSADDLASVARQMAEEFRKLHREKPSDDRAQSQRRTSAWKSKVLHQIHNAYGLAAFGADQQLGSLAKEVKQRLGRQLDEFAEFVLPTICHGDSHLGNVLIKGRDVTGVIDWEKSHEADPLRDIEQLNAYSVYEAPELFQLFWESYTAGSEPVMGAHRLQFAAGHRYLSLLGEELFRAKTSRYSDADRLGMWRERLTRWLDTPLATFDASNNVRPPVGERSGIAANASAHTRQKMLQTAAPTTRSNGLDPSSMAAVQDGRPILITGATTTGKTDVAWELARKIKRAAVITTVPFYIYAQSPFHYGIGLTRDEPPSDLHTYLYKSRDPRQPKPSESEVIDLIEAACTDARARGLLPILEGASPDSAEKLMERLDPQATFILSCPRRNEHDFDIRERVRKVADPLVAEVREIDKAGLADSWLATYGDVYGPARRCAQGEITREAMIDEISCFMSGLAQRDNGKFDSLVGSNIFRVPGGKQVQSRTVDTILPVLHGGFELNGTRTLTLEPS